MYNMFHVYYDVIVATVIIIYLVILVNYYHRIIANNAKMTIFPSKYNDISYSNFKLCLTVSVHDEIFVFHIILLCIIPIIIVIIMNVHECKYFLANKNNNHYL